MIERKAKVCDQVVQSWWCKLYAYNNSSRGYKVARLVFLAKASMHFDGGFLCVLLWECLVALTAL